MSEAITNSTTPRRRTSILLLLLVALHCVFNLLINPMSFNMTAPYEWLKLMLFAVIMAQPVLVAEWAVLGPGAATRRFPITFAAGMLMAFCGYYTGLGLFNNGQHSNWSSAQFAYIWAIAFPAVMVALIPFRSFTGWRVESRTSKTSGNSASNQFSLKYLLILTTACALLFGIAHILAPSGTNEIVRALTGIGLLMLAIFPTFAVPMVTLIPRLTKPALIGFPFAWAAVSWLALETVMATGPGETRMKIARNIALLQIGAAISALVSAWFVRRTGYRLVRGANCDTARTELEPSF